MLLLSGGLVSIASADVIPYNNIGSPNPVVYTFTAASSGNVIAYFAGGTTAGYDNQLGMEVNGVLTSAGFCLDNHSSAFGDSCNLGAVNAGDTLVFVMKNNSLGGAYVYSDPSLNTSYDTDGTKGHNHIYSTAYTQTSPIIDSIPAGTYVGFEDLRFPNADFNYVDEAFVFTNVSVASTPEPTGIILLATIVLLVAIGKKRLLVA